MTVQNKRHKICRYPSIIRKADSGLRFQVAVSIRNLRPKPGDIYRYYQVGSIVTASVRYRLFRGYTSEGYRARCSAGVCRVEAIMRIRNASSPCVDGRTLHGMSSKRDIEFGASYPVVTPVEHTGHDPLHPCMGSGRFVVGLCFRIILIKNSNLSHLSCWMPTAWPRRVSASWKEHSNTQKTTAEEHYTNVWDTFRHRPAADSS